MPKSSKSTKAANETQKPENTHDQGTRETLESIIVAFVLAFLFRAFVAEAFVIPTGSMAPTLMGAHKDLSCELCGQSFQVGASLEYTAGTSKLSGATAVAGYCSACRGRNEFDLRSNRNHYTFNGDRILVSKFDYVLSKPKRWDVFVFKNPNEARINFIKRLVGLPNEQLLIRGGDLYTRASSNDLWSIARKPPKKIRPMSRLVSDTRHQADVLLKNNWPSLWQPWSPTGDTSQGFAVKQSIEDGWSATLEPSSSEQWLRYFHKVPSPKFFDELTEGEDLSGIKTADTQLITDFLAYNSAEVAAREQVYDRGGNLYETITSENRAYSALSPRMPSWPGNDNYGRNWVSDLICEVDLEVGSDAGELLLDIVEFGIHYRCTFNIDAGTVAVSAIVDGQPVELLPTENVAKSGINGPGNYKIEFANFDESLTLWVNGQLVEFESPLDFDSWSVRPWEKRRPYWSENDPLDAAPLGIGARNLKLAIDGCKVHRDIYYIAQSTTPRYVSASDLQQLSIQQVRNALPADFAGRDVDDALVKLFSSPRWWADTTLFSQRRQLEFTLDDEQYFAMGDNSAQSADTRMWRGRHYVDQKFLLGKALLVFWPHSWNAPIPFTPNFSRMGLIR